MAVPHKTRGTPNVTRTTGVRANWTNWLFTPAFLRARLVFGRRRFWGQVLLYWFCIFEDIGLRDNSEARASGYVYGAVFEA